MTAIFYSTNDANYGFMPEVLITLCNNLEKNYFMDWITCLSWVLGVVG